MKLFFGDECFFYFRINIRVAVFVSFVFFPLFFFFFEKIFSFLANRASNTFIFEAFFAPQTSDFTIFMAGKGIKLAIRAIKTRHQTPRGSAVFNISYFDRYLKISNGSTWVRGIGMPTHGRSSQNKKSFFSNVCPFSYRYFLYSGRQWSDILAI